MTRNSSVAKASNVQVVAIEAEEQSLTHLSPLSLTFHLFPKASEFQHTVNTSTLTEGKRGSEGNRARRDSLRAGVDRKQIERFGPKIRVKCGCDEEKIDLHRAE